MFRPEEGSRVEERRHGFAAFVRESQSLARTAYLLTGRVDQAEDLLQAALLKLRKQWPRLRDPANADAYARRIMVTTLASWAEAVAGRAPGGLPPRAGRR